MKEYMFVFGRDPELSYFEVLSYFQSNNIKFEVNLQSEYITTFLLENINPKKIISELGGTVRIGEIISSPNNVYLGEKNRIKYAISEYDDTDTEELRDKIKSHFKKQKLKAVLKNPRRERFLMPHEVLHHKLIDEGVEFLVFNNLVAKTIAVFNPFEHEERDTKRPYNDYLKTISIRLAKIMINLSQVKENETLLDPFCGYGLILQEALLRNINVLGVDNDKKSVEASEENLAWLKKNYKFRASWKLFNKDCRKISRFLKNADAVATEPYLGPFLQRQPSEKEAMKIKNELEKLYSDLLQELQKAVTGKIAIIIPRFRTNNEKIISLDFLKIANKNNFKAYILEGTKMPILYLTGRIQREIWVLENK